MASWRFMALSLTVVLVVAGWPLGRAVWMSLHRNSASDGQPAAFIGLDNYTAVLSSGQWWKAVGFLAAWTAVVVIAQLVVGLVIGASLHQLTVIAPVMRVVVLVPFAAVAVAAATGAIAGIDGGFVAQWAGISSQAGPVRILGAVAVAEVWRGSGVVALILLAGFARTSPELSEWLHAEGAGLRARLGKVVLPGIVPALTFAAVFRVLDTWRGFAALRAAQVQDSVVGFPQTLIFGATFGRFEYGLAATMAVVLLVVTLIAGIAARFGLHRARLLAHGRTVASHTSRGPGLGGPVSSRAVNKATISSRAAESAAQ